MTQNSDSATTDDPRVDFCRGDRHVFRLIQNDWTSSEVTWREPDGCYCGEWFYVGWKNNKATYRRVGRIYW